jgi:uncharacterized protein YcfJ
MTVQIKVIVSALCLGSASFAGAADFDDYARVVRVNPQYEQVNQPTQECRTEYVQTTQQQPQQRGVGGSIIGGIAGGLLGNQVGGGHGRTAATAAGAIAGAIVGDRMENTNNTTNAVVTEQPVRHCRTVDNWQTRTNGYAVTYEYNGHTYTNVMPYDPGERMRVRVSVAPRM